MGEMCATGGARAGVFTPATRLTRLTRVLQRAPAPALREAPDWPGGTKIGDSLGAFLDTHGAREWRRGAVVAIVSDGWETGSPAPFRPATGGMVAARPYCDAVVSAERLDAIGQLLAAITGCASRD